jgi:hypothetical protein
MDRKGAKVKRKIGCNMKEIADIHRLIILRTQMNTDCQDYLFVVEGFSRRSKLREIDNFFAIISRSIIRV